MKWSSISEFFGSGMFRALLVATIIIVGIGSFAIFEYNLSQKRWSSLCENGAKSIGVAWIQVKEEVCERDNIRSLRSAALLYHSGLSELRSCMDFCDPFDGSCRLQARLQSIIEVNELYASAIVNCSAVIGEDESLMEEQNRKIKSAICGGANLFELIEACSANHLDS